jgi:hypothetical protein
MLFTGTAWEAENGCLHILGNADSAIVKHEAMLQNKRW